jgi:hypothetical protein
MDATEIRKMLDRRWHDHLMKRFDEQEAKAKQARRTGRCSTGDGTRRFRGISTRS